MTLTIAQILTFTYLTVTYLRVYYSECCVVGTRLEFAFGWCLILLLWPRVSVCEWRRCLCPGGYPFHKKIIKTKPQWNGIWKRYIWRLWLWLLSAPAWKFNTRNFLLIFFGSHQDGHHGIGDKLHGAFSSTSRQQRFKRLTRIEETVMLQLRHSLLKGPE